MCPWCFIQSVYFTQEFSPSLCLSSLPPPRVNSCPNNCSGRGECLVNNSTGAVYCDCEDNWKGAACDVPYCLADCGFPERGQCQGKVCVCNTGWQGGPTLQQKLSERQRCDLIVSHTALLLTMSLGLLQQGHSCQTVLCDSNKLLTVLPLCSLYRMNSETALEGGTSYM